MVSGEGDREQMRMALRLGDLGHGQTAPNPMVGAVVVQGRDVVGRGWHARFGAPHAEVVALGEAGERARGATLYVTLEPCAHHGKTPPCVDAIVRAGVARVVAAATDPNPAAAGGIEALRRAGVRVDVGVLEDEAREANAPFFFSFGSDRPWVTLKLALSLDGALADATGTRGEITGPEARRHAHHLRAGAQGVAVGMGTVRIDDPLLTVRDVEPPRLPPARIVFTRRGELPVDSRLARTVADGRVIVTAVPAEAAHARALEAMGVELVNTVSLDHALRELKARGLDSILVEGGAAIAGALLEAGLVDRLVLIHAPLILGRGSVYALASAPAARTSSALRLPLVRELRLGNDRLLEFALRAP